MKAKREKDGTHREFTGRAQKDTSENREAEKAHRNGHDGGIRPIEDALSDRIGHPRPNHKVWESANFNKKKALFKDLKGKYGIHSTSKSRQSPIKKVSVKQSRINSALQKVYDEISEERGHWCESCGSTEYLSHSHVIPRSIRPDLQLRKDGVFLQCMSRDGVVGCHDSLEYLLLVRELLG